MTLSTETLIAEADRLVARAERQLRRDRGAGSRDAMVGAEQTLKKLQLYRAILTSRNAAHALMPEHIRAVGFFESGDREGEPI
jgi:hypothetical protein